MTEQQDIKDDDESQEHGRSGVGTTGKSFNLGKALFFLVALLVLAMVFGMSWVSLVKGGKEKPVMKAVDAPPTADAIVIPKQQIPIPPADGSAAGEMPPAVAPMAPPPPVAKRVSKSASPLALPGSNSSSPSGQSSVSVERKDEATALGNMLRPVKLNATSAAMIGKRDYILPQGANIGCALTVALNSQLPGFVACATTRDVYSDNGHTLLIERGSKIVGTMQSGVKQGSNRVFILWQRVETTKGVIIDVDSPATDALGASGVDGYLDTHFWSRFGAAMLLTVVDSASQALATSESKAINGGNSTNVYSGSSGGAGSGQGGSIAGEALRNTINIPPNITKNQGEEVSVFVARDLDFESVISNVAIAD